jgi:hypothetical protein
MEPQSRSQNLDWAKVHKKYKATSAPNYPGSNEAFSTASFLNAVAWLTMIVLLLGGAILVIYQDSSYSSYAPFFDRHPYALLGISSIIVGSIQMTAVIMLASFVKATVTFQDDVGRFMHALLKAQPSEPSTNSPGSTTDDQSKSIPPPSAESTFSGTPSDNGHAAGWYPDPYGGSSRWWDGKNWSGVDPDSE